MKQYVNMIDSFMSGWGKADKGRNVLCIECPDYETALAVEAYAKTRPEQKRVAISNKPRRGYPSDFRQIKSVEEFPFWLSRGKEILGQ